MRRGDVAWADVPPPFGRRPVVILTRDAAIPVLTAYVVAPVTSTRRGIGSEVPLGEREGLREESVAACDALVSVARRDFDPDPVGRLGPEKIRLLDQALRYALDIWY